MSPAAVSLWLAVIGSGVYHGVNPGMGWPLAVSAGLMDQRRGRLALAILALAAGHFAAMAVMLLPFAAISALVAWQAEVRICAALLVIALGVYLLVNRRHPRFLARVPPSRLVLWSFLVATAHGAGLMLVPIYLGMGHAQMADQGHMAAATLMSGGVAWALAVAGVHTVAMTAAGGTMASAVYFWLGLKFLSRSWFNLDVVWALSLVVVGVISLVLAGTAGAAAAIQLLAR